MAKTVNEAVRDDLVLHQIRILRLSNEQVRYLVGAVNRLINKVTSLVRDGEASRIDALLVAVRAIVRGDYADVASGLLRRMEALASYEADAFVSLLNGRIPVALDFTRPTPIQLLSIMDRPMLGRSFDEWMRSLSGGMYQRVVDTVRAGFYDGKPSEDIARALRGTRAASFTDGVLQTDRRSAEALARTLTNHYATHGREILLEQNADLFKGVQWVSTLDKRTTPICQERDGEIYPVDSGPRPPAHINCRSTIVPVLRDADDLGLPASTRASMDGQVADDITYQDWLQGQPADVQDEVLGKTRAQLFRKGGLTLDAFTNEQGTYYTLDALRRREQRAFRRAGL
jgi:SPP1 gp7 family putative phage head morphogenesis protein